MQHAYNCQFNASCENQLKIFILLFCLLCFFLIGCTSQQEDSHYPIQTEKVVVIGHFYPILKPQYLEILKTQIEAIDNLSAIILAGDMVPQSTMPHYNMLEDHFTSHFNVPIYYIPANHEMTNESLFTKIGGKYTSIKNTHFYTGGHKFVLYSAHKATEKASKANLDCANTEELTKSIKERSFEYKNSFLILADMRCHRKKEWQENVQPLIDKYIDFVIVGDNESTKYTYTWEEYNGVPYIYQGITHRGHDLSGENTFLVIDKESIEVHHLKIKNALDNAYKTNKRFKKLK